MHVIFKETDCNGLQWGLVTNSHLFYPHKEKRNRNWTHPWSVWYWRRSLIYFFRVLVSLGFFCKLISLLKYVSCPSVFVPNFFLPHSEGHRTQSLKPYCYQLISSGILNYSSALSIGASWALGCQFLSLSPGYFVVTFAEILAHRSVTACSVQCRVNNSYSPTDTWELCTPVEYEVFCSWSMYIPCNGQTGIFNMSLDLPLSCDHHPWSRVQTVLHGRCSPTLQWSARAFPPNHNVLLRTISSSIPVYFLSLAADNHIWFLLDQVQSARTEMLPCHIVFLPLDCFIQWNNLQDHPCCCKLQNSILLMAE